MRRFLLYFLAAMAGAVMCSAKPGTVGSNQKNSRNAVVIEISPSGFGREAPHVYPQKNPIKIRCVIRNTGKRSVDFQLKDHDAYHGTLPYPIGTAVQVVSDGGEVVTANDIDRSGEGWWSQYFVWSTTFEPFMPGDNIHIDPPRISVAVPR